MKMIFVLFILISNFFFLFSDESGYIKESSMGLSICKNKFFLSEIKFTNIVLFDFKYFSLGLYPQVVFNNARIKYKIYNFFLDYSNFVSILNNITLREKFGIVFTFKIPIS